jgi:L-amino acid N-acyltransferase YncA
MDVNIEPMTASDWESVRRIYEEGLATGNATFETTCPGWEEWNARHHSFCRLIARSGHAVNGWAALSPVSSRAVYAGVAEVSIYVTEAHRGQGAGTALMGVLVIASEAAGLWTLQASIFPENTASIALHQRHGFRAVGKRERIGCLSGEWRDTVLLERRSSTSGS